MSTQRLDIAPLPLRIQRVEYQARFSAAARSGHHREPSSGQAQGQILQVVLSRSSDDDIGRHSSIPPLRRCAAEMAATIPLSEATPAAAASYATP